MLEVTGLDAWWGQAQALFAVDLRVHAGELVVLQGLNGAGKSTLMQSLMGAGPRTAGSIVLGAQQIAQWPSHRRAQAGLGWVPEDRRLFAALSVQDNLELAARGSDVVRNRTRCLNLFPALAAMLKRPAGQMSGGEQQMLAIARTLMTQPQLLLLDEPCEGISPLLVQSIRDALLQLKGEGVTLVVAEQNRVLAAHADRVVTLVAGRVGSVALGASAVPP